MKAHVLFLASPVTYLQLIENDDFLDFDQSCISLL